MTLAIEAKYDSVRQLLLMGKERGYLLYDEVNDLLPAEVHSSEEIDDVLSAFDDAGIEILEEAPKKSPTHEPAATEGKPAAGSAEEVELDLAPGALDKTNDPVRMYLREMGTVPLLTREGEVAIAKRIERGQLRVLKALSRLPIVIKEVIALGEALRRSERTIKGMVQFDDDELTEDRLADKTKQLLHTLDKLAHLHEQSRKLYTRMKKIRARKTRRAIRARWALARARVQAGRLLRSIEFSHPERKPLITSLRRAVSELHQLDRDILRLYRRVEVGSEVTAREARRELRELRARVNQRINWKNWSRSRPKSCAAPSA
jgi:RNA polymerase primary sigma factor